MFETESCVPLCARVAGKRATGIAAERPSLPHPAPSLSPRASGVLGTNRFTLECAHRPALSWRTNRDTPVARPAKCAWTDRGGAVWSAFTARRAGIEMACMGGTTGGRRDDVPTANLPDTVRDHLVLTSALGARAGCQSCTPVVASALRSGRRIPGARGVDSGGVRGRIGGAGAHRTPAEGGGWTARAGGGARGGNARGKPAGCAKTGAVGTEFRGGRLTPDNCCYRASNS